MSQSLIEPNAYYTEEVNFKYTDPNSFISHIIEKNDEFEPEFDDEGGEETDLD